MLNYWKKLIQNNQGKMTQEELNTLNNIFVSLNATDREIKHVLGLGENLTGEALEKEAEKIAPVVGLSALKYGDLSNQASKDYVFDVDRFSSFEGDTGPYILYTIVRIKSILAKYKEQGGNWEEKIKPAKLSMMSLKARIRS